MVANKFDHEKTYNCMLQHSEWRLQWLPVEANDRTLQILVAAADARAKDSPTSSGETTASDPSS